MKEYHILPLNEYSFVQDNTDINEMASQGWAVKAVYKDSNDEVCFLMERDTIETMAAACVRK